MAMKSTSKAAILGSLLMMLPVNASKSQELAWDAKNTLLRLREAVDVMKRDCGVDILNPSHPMEFQCGGRLTTVGNVWSDALDKAGFPRDAVEREAIARKIGLDKADEFNFVYGRASDVAVSRLLFNLKLLSERG